MNRTVFLIDGFNLYHSVRAAEWDLNGASTRWLNIRALCDSFLHVIGNNAQTEGVYYFSALAEHLEASKPDVTERHKAFIKCLEDTGVTVELARFKKKTITCDNCNSRMERHEEKETDVAIAAKLLELFFRNSCDSAVLVTGDTDLAPAVRTVQGLFPAKNVHFAFPYRRKNKELAKLVSKTFNIKKQQYARYQFPDPVVLNDGSKVNKPAHW